jgi:hypothetical protein
LFERPHYGMRDCHDNPRIIGSRLAI